MTDSIFIIITNHGYDRLKERVGYNKKTAERMVEKVYRQGLSIDSSNLTLKKYLRAKNERYDYKNTYRIYGDFLFVFSTEKDNIYLITVFGLQESMKKQAQYSRQKGKIA